MSNTATITGTLGPGEEVTSLALTNVKSVNFDFVARTVRVDHGDKTQYFSYADVSTVTFSISGTSTTVTVS